ncbi:FMRFamide-related peptides [Drosophila bipectinata]|uniref:FMRFamide-related peptides n=1 Tax=Drosophila bipectinata TaxID=42026 RepID=UPI001C88F657|nr:FMRFamide-related peptides [Drosophila bipectinata]
MGIALMFLLALYQMQSAIHSEIIETPFAVGGNSLLESPDIASEILDQVPQQDNELLEPEKAQLEFNHPISVIGVDYGKNAVILRFQKHGRKPRYKYDPELEAKRRTLQDNFMHFGKRQVEELPLEDDPDMDAVKRSGISQQDLMRYGRDPKQDFMRFGRDPKQDFMRFGRAPSDFMRFGRTPLENFMRLGRSDNFMRFGRSPHEEFRSPKQDFMRFGRPDNFMRFGRSAPPEFSRNGKMDSNFMRFGKSIKPTTLEHNQTKPAKLSENILKKEQQEQAKSNVDIASADDDQEPFFAQ